LSINTIAQLTSSVNILKHFTHIKLSYSVFEEPIKELKVNIQDVMNSTLSVMPSQFYSRGSHTETCLVLCNMPILSVALKLVKRSVLPRWRTRRIWQRTSWSINWKM